MMTTHEHVYEKFGKVAELAQMLETELGSLLFADEGLKQGACSQDDWNSGHEVLAAIDKQTLGRLLKTYRDRFPAASDVDEVMSDALAARNRLIHGFYLSHGSRIETADGRDRMIADLEQIWTALWPAYEFAATLADLLLQEAVHLRGASHAG